mmetsp:Transcript_10076/g.29784  ORF Transcript_10076/g.29784 Transcript_10076/m.29784 type:complete len:517 (-) Transcript_10076:19-1569(-)
MVPKVRQAGRRPGRATRQACRGKGRQQETAWTSPAVEPMGPPEKASMLKLTPSEVVAAVRSLYADSLKPVGRVLLKRVRELAAAALSQGLPEPLGLAEVPRVDPRHLRHVAEACSDLTVNPEDGREYSVLLRGESKEFVDVRSPDDPFPQALWEELEAYLAGLSGEGIYLPGGRYACAQALAAHVPLLGRRRSLGEVCHVVQLCVSTKKLLGYLDGNMVPYRFSEEWLKEQCAVWQQPVCNIKKSSGTMPLATWEQARAYLRIILNSVVREDNSPSVVTLSNVKRIFRSRFNLELSETALGFSRLCELLKDARFQDVCRVESRGNGQVVVQRVDCCAQLDMRTAYLPPGMAWAQEQQVLPGMVWAQEEQVHSQDGSLPSTAANSPTLGGCGGCSYACFASPPGGHLASDKSTQALIHQHYGLALAEDLGGVGPMPTMVDGAVGLADGGAVLWGLVACPLPGTGGAMQSVAALHFPSLAVQEQVMWPKAAAHAGSGAGQHGLGSAPVGPMVTVVLCN